MDRGRSDDVLQAIEGAMAGVSIAARPLARARLRKSNTPSEGFRISSSAGRFSIKDDDKPLIVVWTGGEPIQWKLLDGQVFDVLAKADGEAVSLTFRAAGSGPTAVWAGSERTTVYRGVGRELVAQTVIIGPQLSAPIRYRLVYARDDGISPDRPFTPFRSAGEGPPRAARGGRFTPMNGAWKSMNWPSSLLGAVFVHRGAAAARRLLRRRNVSRMGL